MNVRTFFAAMAGAALALMPLGASACGTCGCTLNSDWTSQGFGTGTGFHMDLRFDYFDQDQLRTGTGVVDKAHIVFPTEQEIQLRTINRNMVLDLGYSPRGTWGVDLIVPAMDRTHSTIGEDTIEPSYSRSSGVGDTRLLARYQGFSTDRSFGLQLGLKLPTGRIDDRFSTGPLEGETVDRGLQPGSGTTDLLLGISKFGTIAPEWGYFVQAMGQLPLDEKDGFKPGESLTVSGGFRYTGWSRVTPQFQLNVKAEKPETGINADTANSGATMAAFSPGLTVRILDRMHIFVFLQVPVFQRVTGFQLEPHYLLTLGLHFSF
jgi:hypothetical protein